MSDAQGNQWTFNADAAVNLQAGVPATPTGLTATAGIGSIRFEWDENTEPDMVNGYGEYRFEFDNNSDFSSPEIDKRVGVNSHVVSGLTTGTTYYARVTAIDADGNASAASGSVSAVPVQTVEGDIAANAVTNTQIATDAVNTDSIADDAVDSLQIADGAVSVDAIDRGVVGSGLILNPSFEADSNGNGRPDGWLYSEGAGSISRTLDATCPDGDYVLEVSDTNGAGGSRAFPTEPGKTYAIRFWVKHSDGTGNFYPNVNYRSVYPSGTPSPADYITISNRTGWEYLTSPAATANSTLTSWTKFELTWTAPANAYWTSIMFYNYSGSTGVLYVDGLEFFEQVTNVGIGNDAVDTAQIADDAVDTLQIAPTAVSETKIAPGAITTGKIYANAVDTGQLATNAVTADKIFSNAVTTAKIDANAVTTAKLDTSVAIVGKLTTDSGAGNLDLDGDQLDFDTENGQQTAVGTLKMSQSGTHGVGDGVQGTIELRTPNMGRGYHEMLMTSPGSTTGDGELKLAVFDGLGSEESISLDTEALHVSRRVSSIWGGANVDCSTFYLDSQSISNATWTSVDHTSGRLVSDKYGMNDSFYNWFEIPAGFGDNQVYLVTGMTRVPASSGGVRAIRFGYYQSSSSTWFYEQVGHGDNPNIYIDATMSAAVVYPADEGDRFNFQIWQSSGSTQGCQFNFAVTHLGPEGT